MDVDCTSSEVTPIQLFITKDMTGHLNAFNLKLQRNDQLFSQLLMIRNLRCGLTRWKHKTDKIGSLRASKNATASTILI